MRKGITQEQVDAAADALVAAGDRPTVDRIRAVLGTGSPNTVIRMLDHWRESLAKRIVGDPEIASRLVHSRKRLILISIAPARPTDDPLVRSFATQLTHSGAVRDAFSEPVENRSGDKARRWFAEVRRGAGAQGRRGAGAQGRRPQ